MANPITGTAKRLIDRVQDRAIAAGGRHVSKDAAPDVLERFIRTLAEQDAIEIDRLRLALDQIDRTATVGALSPVGYRNALAAIRELVADALKPK